MQQTQGSAQEFDAGTGTSEHCTYVSDVYFDSIFRCFSLVNRQRQPGMQESFDFALYPGRGWSYREATALRTQVLAAPRELAKVRRRWFRRGTTDQMEVALLYSFVDAGLFESRFEGCRMKFAS